MNIAGVRVRSQRAVERDLPDDSRDRVGQRNPSSTADARDHERFGQKLQQDMPFPRAQGLLDSDLARSLLHAHQHDIHQPDTRNTQRQRADKQQQHL